MAPDERTSTPVNKGTLISALRGGRHRHIFVSSRPSRRHSVVTVRGMEGKKEGERERERKKTPLQGTREMGPCQAGQKSILCTPLVLSSRPT